MARDGRGWYGDTPGHRGAALKAGARSAMNTPMRKGKVQQGEKQLTIHWWNMGRKTLDFKGSYSDFLKLKGITMKKITHPFQKDTKGLRFKIPVGSRLATLDAFDSNFYTNADDAIQIFLTLLGDKTEFITAYGRERRLNWR